MKIKLFSGSPDRVEKHVNDWLNSPGNRVIKISESSALCSSGGDTDDYHLVTVMIEYEPLA